MKKLVMIAALSAMMAPGMAAASDCKPASEYKVSNLSYVNMPLHSALSKTLSTTPLIANIQPGIGNVEVSAESVSGNLDKVLDEMARGVGFVWKQSGCDVSFGKTVAGATPADTKTKSYYEPSAPDHWVLQAGLPIHAQLIEWSKRAGWTLEWNAPKGWEARGAEFSGSFLTVVSEIVNGLYAEGRPVRMVAWEGNKLIEVISNDVK